MRVMVLLIGGVLAASPAWAQNAGDAQQGAGLARDWCSSCHVVGTAPGGGGTDAVPSFVSIARNPAKGPDYVRRVLSAPHPPMPPMPLSRMAVNDLVAYFRQLAETR